MAAKDNASAQFYCNEEEWARLEAVAAMHGQSVNHWIRSVLRARLAAAQQAPRMKGGTRYVPFWSAAGAR